MESHTKQQSPETVLEMELRAKRSKSAGLRARTWEREQWIFFFWRQVMMWYEEISEGAHVGTTNHKGMPGGLGAPSAHLVHLPLILFAPKNLKYSEKIILKFQSILRTFIFGSFFYCTENSKNRQSMEFYFI